MESIRKLNTPQNCRTVGLVYMGILILVVIVALILAIVDPLKKSVPTGPARKKDVMSWRVDEFTGRDKGRGQQKDWRFSVFNPTSLNRMDKELRSAVAEFQFEDAKAGLSLEKLNMQCMIAHNYYRRQHSSPKLALSSSLIDTAEETAQLDYDSIVDDNNEYGTNKYVTTFDRSAMRYICKDAVQQWYLEGANYVFEKERVRGRSLSFTQVIWKQTKYVGCAFGVNLGNIVIVCQYEPRGNIVDLYKQNVPPLVNQ